MAYGVEGVGEGVESGLKEGRRCWRLLPKLASGTSIKSLSILTLRRLASQLSWPVHRMDTWQW